MEEGEVLNTTAFVCVDGDIVGVEVVVMEVVAVEVVVEVEVKVVVVVVVTVVVVVDTGQHNNKSTSLYPHPPYNSTNSATGNLDAMSANAGQSLYSPHIPLGTSGVRQRSCPRAETPIINSRKYFILKIPGSIKC